MAKRYKDIKSGTHIPYKDNKNITGTARYASLFTHMGIEQSRRDDLESFCYVMFYLLRDGLPWKSLAAKNKREKYKKIMECKESCSAEILCEGYPEEFKDLLNYTRSLAFEEDPDYDSMKKSIAKVFEKNEYINDKICDWNKQAVPKKESLLGRTNPIIKKHNHSKPKEVFRSQSQHLGMKTSTVRKSSENVEEMRGVPLGTEPMYSITQTLKSDLSPSAGMVGNVTTTMVVERGNLTTSLNNEKKDVMVVTTKGGCCVII